MWFTVWNAARSSMTPMFVASAYRGTEPATPPARVATLELLAKELF